MDAFVTFYFPHPSGSGWVDAGMGRISIRSEHGMTEELARQGLYHFIKECIPDHPNAPKPYDPTRVVASASFGDLGWFYVNGNGERQEPVMRNE